VLSECPCPQYLGDLLPDFDDVTLDAEADGTIEKQKEIIFSLSRKCIGWAGRVTKIHIHHQKYFR